MILKLINFLCQTFGTDKNTAATILVTIFTFTGGIIITILFKMIEGILDRRNHRKLLKLNVLNLLKGIFRQASAYDKLSKQLKIDHNGSFNFSQKSISAIGVLEQLGYKKLHSSLFNGIENIRFKNHAKKRIAFNDLWSVVEFLKVFHQSSFAVMKEFLELNLRANELRNKSLGNANKIIERTRLTLDKMTVSQDLGTYAMTIEQYIVTLQQQDNYTNPKVINDLYVHKILELNRNNTDVLKKYWNLINPIELNAALLETEAGYQNQKNLMDTYSYNFIELNKSFMTNYDKLKNGYKILF